MEVVQRSETGLVGLDCEFRSADELECGSSVTQSKSKGEIDHALESLARELEQGKSSALVEYLKTMARFHRYSLGNQLLIWNQNPEATHVAGFQTWKKLGRFVKKGTKGICIRAPIVRKKTNDDLPESEHLFGFRRSYVFDIAQTEGKELVEFSKVAGEPGLYLNRLQQFAESNGIVIEHSAEMNGAEGWSHGGKITLREGMNSAEEFSTLAHEIAHELLHQGPEKNTKEKKVRETEAEAVAYVIPSVPTSLRQ